MIQAFLGLLNKYVEKNEEIYLKGDRTRIRDGEQSDFRCSVQPLLIADSISECK